MMKCRNLATATAVTVMLAVPASAGPVGFEEIYDDFDGWQGQAGPFTRIDFGEHEPYTLITDQYADLGVTFPDGNDFIFPNSSFGNDQGLHGGHDDLHITIEFDEPQAWVGIDFVGIAGFDVYQNGEVIYETDVFGAPPGAPAGTPTFLGVVGDQPVIDTVVVHRGTSDTPALIDNLYWGVPGPGGVAALALAGLLGGSRRRRR